MSIATEIERLQSAKVDIMAALVEKGVDVTGKNLVDVPDLIDSIEVVPKYLVVDGKQYKIGKMPDGRTWMLENLAYLVEGATYNNNQYAGTYGQAYIDTFGYMYTAVAANSISSSVPGWHVPSLSEWNALIAAVGATYDTALPILGSSKAEYWNGKVCQDTYGFNALPGGYTDSGFGSVGKLGRYHALLTNRHVALWFNPNNSGKLTTSEWSATDVRKHSSIRLIKDA